MVRVGVLVMSNVVPVELRAMAEEFLAERCVRDPRSACWVWQGALSNGYGRLQKDGQMWSAHRFAYHHLVGYLHKSEPVHHACANRACVEPEHLQRVTAAQNTAEMLGRVAMEEELQDLREGVALRDAQIAAYKRAFDIIEKELGYE